MLTLNKKRVFGALLSGAFVGSSLIGGLAFAGAAPEGTTGIPDKMVHHGGGKHHGKGGHGHHRCGIMKQLNLTTEQKEKLKTVHETFRKQNEAEFANLRTRHEQLKAIPRDEANAEKRKALRAELKQQHHKLMEKHHSMMSGILTPEQMSRMEKAKQECKAKHRAAKKAAKSDK